MGWRFDKFVVCLFGFLSDGFSSCLFASGVQPGVQPGRRIKAWSDAHADSHASNHTARAGRDIILLRLTRGACAFSSSKTTCTRIRRRLLPLARSRVRDNRSEKHDQFLNDAGRRALFEGYNRLDVALYRNATAIWCAEWYNAIGDRESCVRTYAHARPGTPSPCTRDAVAAMA